MDKYEKVERPREEPEIKDNEIRITTKGKVRNSISYATTLFKEKGFTEVVLKAMGRAINKTVTIAEIIKRRIPNLHQITEISSTDITDVYEPLEEGLDTIETTRHVSSITIILSTVPLDTSAPGYQAPLPEEQVKDQSASQPSATSPVPGTVQPLKGPRRGAATRGGRGPRGGMRGGHQGNDSDFGHGALAIGPEGDGALIMPQLAQTVPQGNHPSQRPLNAAPFRGRGRGGHGRRGGGFGMSSQGAYSIPVAGFIQQPQQGYLGVYPQPQGFVAYPTAIPIMAAPQGLPLNGGMLRGGYGGRGGRGGRRGGRGGFTGGVMDTQPHLVPPQHQLQGDASSAGFLPRRSVRGARGGRGGRRGSSSVQQGDSQGAHGSPAGNQPAQQQS